MGRELIIDHPAVIEIEDVTDVVHVPEKEVPEVAARVADAGCAACRMAVAVHETYLFRDRRGNIARPAGKGLRQERT
jgi:hypothetical protein